MLFNSLEFLFLFLPATLALFVVAGKLAGPNVARLILLAASLFFYTWWEIWFLPVLLVSIAVNYGAGLALANARPGTIASYRWLVAAITVNLLGLAYYKYTAFAVGVFSDLTALDLTVSALALPLGISFVTFHQITYLVHVYRTGEDERDPVKYGLFVAFFPQLLAGPISYAKEMLPQLRGHEIGKLISLDLAAGLTIFAIGLFKKVVLADGVAPVADAVFGAAESGTTVGMIEAWVGVVAYAFQIYFDFSGYSDMAVGLARMFGIRLPLNFYSPYKAASIIEFWRRWHISLSRFLRDYLYIPLGGNRGGTGRWLANLAMTMLLGGLWHGAGWTFVIWGAVHGSLLIFNHLFRMLMKRHIENFAFTVLSVAATFLLVCIAWTFFRATTLESAWHLISAMLGISPLSDGADDLVPGMLRLLVMTTCALIVWFAPNSEQIIGRYSTVIDAYGHQTHRGDRRWWQWQPTAVWGLFSAVALIMAGALTIESPERFLYFQF